MKAFKCATCERWEKIKRGIQKSCQRSRYTCSGNKCAQPALSGTNCCEQHIVDALVLAEHERDKYKEALAEAITNPLKLDCISNNILEWFDLRSDVEKQIVGALTSAVDDHGPITRINTTSASKRIYAHLKGYRKRYRSK